MFFSLLLLIKVGVSWVIALGALNNDFLAERSRRNHTGMFCQLGNADRGWKLSRPGSRTTGSCLRQFVLLHFLCNSSINAYRILIASGIQILQLRLVFVVASLVKVGFALMSRARCWTRSVAVLQDSCEGWGNSLSPLSFYFAQFILVQSRRWETKWSQPVLCLSKKTPPPPPKKHINLITVVLSISAFPKASQNGLVVSSGILISMFSFT